MNKLREKYNKELKKILKEELKLKNICSVPTLDKIVINVGVGEAVTNPDAISRVREDIAQITGQRPIITRAKAAISNFKIRENQEIGIKVTLRRDRMWDFFEKLIKIVIPRIKDFRGLSKKSFDGFGNYTIGIKEYGIFPEIDINKIDKVRGLQVTIATTAKNDEKALKLLTILGMPFARK